MPVAVLPNFWRYVDAASMSTHKIFSRLNTSVERIALKILADRYEGEKVE